MLQNACPNSDGDLVDRQVKKSFFEIDSMVQTGCNGQVVLVACGGILSPSRIVKWLSVSFHEQCWLPCHTAPFSWTLKQDYWMYTRISIVL